MEELNWADYLILAIIALSAIISLTRGFVREALSLASWVIAFWVALTFSAGLAELLTDYITVPSVRLGVSFAGLLVVTLLLGSLVNFLVYQLVERTGLTGTDRLIGVVFGVARGMVLVAVLVLLGGLTAVIEDPWWRESYLIGHFENLAAWLSGYFPPELADRFNYT